MTKPCSDVELAALSRARLMVSGRYRVPWGIGGEVMASLLKKGLITEGGYLTEAALKARAQSQGKI